MDKQFNAVNEQQLLLTKKNLELHKFEVAIVDDCQQARDLINQEITSTSTISFGGSQTLEDSGIREMLYQRDDVIVHDRYKANITKDERDNILRQAFSDDFYLTSSNAVTMTGELYNVDGTGNRVAAMAFGPKKVLVVVGYNKIVANEQAAKIYLDYVARPKNATRLQRTTPCVKVGYCVECNCEDKICDCFVKIASSHVAKRIKVIIIKEQLGY